MASSSSSSSSWSGKLEARLAALGDAPSKESLQSLAKWIGFNRKHMKAFCTTLRQRLQTDSPTTTQGQWPWLQTIHHVLLLEKDNPIKWDKLEETRIMLGEMVLLPALSVSSSSSNSDGASSSSLLFWKDRMPSLLDEWQEHNVFGTPTVINQMRRILSSGESTMKQKEENDDEGGAVETAGMETAPTKEVSPPPDSAAKVVVVVDEPIKSEQSEKPKEVVKEEEESKLPTIKKEKDVIMDDKAVTVEQDKPAVQRPPSPGRPTLNRSVSVEDVTFDFDGSGIPYSKVTSREFMEPCKAIATLQIARDLRNDAAVQLSSRLSALPEQVKEYCRRCQEVEEEEEEVDLSEEEALEFAELIGDDLLDTDLNEAMSNVRSFMNIVEQQRRARERLIQLLIQSRCQFGSNEAAHAYYGLEGIVHDITERRQALSDAMELEGLDVDAASTEDPQEAEKEKSALAALEPLSWYEPKDEPPAAKRAKI